MKEQPDNMPEGKEIKEVTTVVVIDSVEREDQETAKRVIKETQQEILDTLRRKKREELEEGEPKKAAAPQLEEDEAPSIKTEVKESEEASLLEEGFATIEAQIAYYAFMQAMYEFDVQTGKGIRKARIAMDILKEHYHEMSLDKLFSVLLILFGKMLEKWTTPQEEGEYEASSVDSEGFLGESEGIRADPNQSNTTHHQGDGLSQRSPEILRGNFDNMAHQNQKLPFRELLVPTR